MKTHYTAALLFAIACSATIVLSGCSQPATVDTELQQYHQKVAGELLDNNLASQAAQEYEKVLLLPGLTQKEIGATCYQIARLHFEKTGDYEQAAAYYIRARQADPNASYTTEAAANLVAALERSGRMGNAQRELSSLTAVDSQAVRDANDVPIAKIGARTVWRSEIDAQLADLPAELQKQLLKPESLREFVRQYVGLELVYDAAEREQFTNSKAVRQYLDDSRKKLIVDRFVQQKLGPSIQIDPADIRNYYLANKQRYGGEEFEKVARDVAGDYQQEKLQSAYMTYVAQLAQAGKVEFLDGNIK